MSVPERASVILIQVKNLNDPSHLTFVTGSGVNLNNVTSIRLKGYNVNDGGNPAGVPSHLMLRIQGIRGNHALNVTNFGTPIAMRNHDALHVLYPPGGIGSQTTLKGEIKFSDRTVNLENKRVTLEFLDTSGTVPVYRPYSNYTEAVIELEVDTYIRTSVVKHAYA